MLKAIASARGLYLPFPRMNDSLVARILDIDLWLAGAGHFVILFASFQVPARLGWKENLKHLTPFNRKFVWVQSSFTVLTIIAFGTLTLALHGELLCGDRAALGLAVFIAIYWTVRILVDALYFSHADWPTGTMFVVGHILLTALFCFLAGSYWALIVWRVRR
jgi:alginate O-acetyltransferase complex protein AlgI